MSSMEWSSSGMVAIQEMLLQIINNNGLEIRVMPTWPKERNKDVVLSNKN